MLYSILINCPRGLEYLLQEELDGLGLQDSRVNPQGVFGSASLEILYNIALWSRLANRVQIILCSGPVRSAEDIYALCHAYPWPKEFAVESSVAISFHGTSLDIRNEMFGAQVIKDAMMDCFRDHGGARPDVERQSPDVRIQAYLKKDTLTVCLDFTGYSLHQRGYRLDKGLAPLKENVAAAILIRAKWPEIASQGGFLHDPCCGSGTLVIEALMMAADMAPGLLRQDQAFVHWKSHDETLWQQQRQIAITRQKPISSCFKGSDIDKRAIIAARENAKRAGVADWIEWRVSNLTESTAPIDSRGLVVCNPPYGERLADFQALIPFYQSLGQTLHHHYSGWSAAIITESPELAKALGLRASKQYRLYNGALDCKLYCFQLDETNQFRLTDPNKPSIPEASPEATMFANRLKKNLTHLQKWAKREQISCYRIYDADLPEYAFAIDRYQDHIVLQEYAPPATIPEAVAAVRRQDVMQEIRRVLDIPLNHIVFKRRQQQKGLSQYEKMDKTNQHMIVDEGHVKLEVNLHDYLDTGLFLDHRSLRRHFGTLPANTRFLNCFCYTATASVHAAKAGALTTNIDLSNTYLEWAKRNFAHNQLSFNRHQFIQIDCLSWLQQTKDKFDVIFLDPPSFSNSKRMGQTMSVQRDHETLINLAISRLNPGGILYFSTNLRKFKLSPEMMRCYDVVNISESTIDIDFKRNQRIHHCYKIMAMPHHVSA